MKYSAKPYVLTRDNAPAMSLIGILWMPLATGVLTDNNVCLIEELCHAGSGPPTHAHAQDEVFYVLEGECTFRAGGETIKATPGTLVTVPRNTPHSFSVDKDPSRVLNFYFPAGFEHILLSIAMPAQNRAVPNPEDVPMPPRAIVEELSREYGQMAILGLPFADMPTEENSVTMPADAAPALPVAASAEKSPAYWSQDILWSVLADGSQTGGSYSVLEQLCPKGSGAPPHSHAQDEMFYLLDGELAFVAGDQTFTAKTGAFVYIPRDIPHSFTVESGTARFLNLYTPAGFERTVTELGTPATARELPPPGLKMAASPQKVQTLFEELGTRQVAQSQPAKG